MLVINAFTRSSTGGDALVGGLSIRSGGCMEAIRRVMGVCPQFDILWDSLTGLDHLLLFAAIKGMWDSFFLITS